MSTWVLILTVVYGRSGVWIKEIPMNSKQTCQYAAAQWKREAPEYGYFNAVCAPR